MCALSSVQYSCMIVTADHNSCDHHRRSGFRQMPTWHYHNVYCTYYVQYSDCTTVYSCLDSNGYLKFSTQILSCVAIVRVSVRDSQPCFARKQQGEATASPYSQFAAVHTFYHANMYSSSTGHLMDVLAGIFPHCPSFGKKSSLCPVAPAR